MAVANDNVQFSKLTIILGFWSKYVPNVAFALGILQLVYWTMRPFLFVKAVAQQGDTFVSFWN